jgi:hypothetical protein
MRIWKWSKDFMQYQPLDIPSRVAKTEKIFWCAILLGIALIVAGSQKPDSSENGIFSPGAPASRRPKCLYTRRCC